MDDFMLSSRYTVQRDVIVGSHLDDDIPDVSHFAAEEIISTEIMHSGSSDRSYYGSCGEDSPGSSIDFFDDLIEIKEEIVDGRGTDEISVSVDLTKLTDGTEMTKIGFEGKNDQDDSTEEVLVDAFADDDDDSVDKRYVFLTMDGKPAKSLDDLKEHTVELTDIYSKPKLSYAQLIAESLMAAEGRMLTLSEIYTSVAERHPYYKMDHSRNWQNAIRHNLTLNKCFTKVPRPATEGRGSFWRLEDGAEVLIFKRILARHQQQQNRLKMSQPTIQTFDPARDIVYVTIPDD